ncbi:sigma-70 family RNA polymerase sigma factor [Pseudalkalibacillus hwajinpoensis]|uniref:Sigma-70 family RNA polymerase sigma factor n=1 Tax=Guptibacillus hwajinpoensis TaxID=208199 RepID=A0A4U1MM29_9BACL|nr:sigma-70 family RNA polymerase sigma factor [Pseudalkalibacillus hwajinpoensis]TKD72313.1 sigma-70 family RNA polymerase sigma factor [Pseudalkalibacillus hwajinpoensis]
MHVEQKGQENQSQREILVYLMEEYGDMVLRVAYTYVKEQHLAEDISQEVFIRCYHALHTFERRSSYKTWLYRITVNQCKDYVKSWSFRKLFPKSIIETESDKEVNSVSTHVLKKEENNELFEKVLQLPVKQREVIIFYYYEDLSIDEISEVIKAKPNTIKSRLHRARNSLKDQIGGGIILEE